MPYIIAFVLVGGILAALCASLLALTPPRMGTAGLLVAASLLLVALASIAWPQAILDDRPSTPTFTALLLSAWTLGPVVGIGRARARAADGRRYDREVALGMVDWFLASLLVFGLGLVLKFLIPSFRPA